MKENKRGCFRPTKHILPRKEIVKPILPVARSIYLHQGRVDTLEPRRKVSLETVVCRESFGPYQRERNGRGFLLTSSKVRQLIEMNMRTQDITSEPTVITPKSVRLNLELLYLVGEPDRKVELGVGTLKDNGTCFLGR